WPCGRRNPATERGSTCGSMNERVCCSNLALPPKNQSVRSPLERKARRSQGLEVHTSGQPPTLDNLPGAWQTTVLQFHFQQGARIMAKTNGVNKSQAIRDYFKSNKKAKTHEVIAALAKNGITVTP